MSLSSSSSSVVSLFLFLLFLLLRLLFLSPPTNQPRKEQTKLMDYLFVAATTIVSHQQYTAACMVFRHCPVKFFPPPFVSFGGDGVSSMVIDLSVHPSVSIAIGGDVIEILKLVVCCGASTWKDTAIQQRHHHHHRQQQQQQGNNPNSTDRQWRQRWHRRFRVQQQTNSNWDVQQLGAALVLYSLQQTTDKKKKKDNAILALLVNLQDRASILFPYCAPVSKDVTTIPTTIIVDMQE